MILKEIFLKTNENGELIIGKHILIQMGIGKGEQIYSIFMSIGRGQEKRVSGIHSDKGRDREPAAGCGVRRGSTTDNP